MFKKSVLGILFGASFVLTDLAYSKSYTDLVPGFSRTKSPVMVRYVAQPTRANLDMAVYYANPIRYNPEKETPKPSAKKFSIKDISFKGTVSTVFPALDKTPLTEAERGRQYAWEPVANEIWKEFKTDFLTRVGNIVKGEKWGDPGIFKPYQEIAAFYLRNSGGKNEFWVEIEFAPWVSFISGVQDADSDNIKEVYACLAADSLDVKLAGQIATWLQGVYSTQVLTKPEIVDWANQVASYWYPSLFTDLVPLDSSIGWPTKETEAEIKTFLKKVPIKNPTVVIKGLPFGKPLYTVIVADPAVETKKVTVTFDYNPGSEKHLDTSSAGLTINKTRFSQELLPYKDYSSWTKKNKMFVDCLKKKLSLLPADQMGMVGMNSWLFFRKSFEYIFSGDLGTQAGPKNPIPALKELKQFCDKNEINLLFIPVPNKEEVYYDQIDSLCTIQGNTIIYPYGRKFLADAQAAGIEVVDLLPVFLKAKNEDSSSGELLYQHQDTHWTSRGLMIAAGVIADRIKQYSWYNTYSDRLVKYTYSDTTFLKTGDIVDRLAEKDKSSFVPAKLQGKQVVNPDGSKFIPVAQTPILLMGDSFTGVYESIDCKSAGVGSHISANTGLPVDILTSWGGGPPIRNKMIRTKKGNLKNVRVLIYMMTARDLYNYSTGWEPLIKE